MWDRLGERLGSRRAVYAVALFGCALRLFHYLRNPSVWHDEAALVVNVLANDFAALLGPLQWNEAAPPLFLWLERAAVLLLGDNTYALRLIPLVVSCLSLLLFAVTVRRWLNPWGAFWAMLLFAASDRMSWHAAEAKPYAVDVFVASAALFLAVQLRDCPLPWRILLFALLSPIAIFLSFPACFVAGAMLLHLAPEVWRAGWRQRLLYVGWAVVVAGSFALLYFGPIRAQRNEAIEGCWRGHFPDWSRPWSVPVWSFTGTCEVVRYAFMPIGNLLALFGLVGVVWLWRTGRRRDLLLLAGPLALAWAAALVHGYPYGGSRLEAFAVPGLAVLLATGADPARRWLAARRRWAALGVVVLLLTPLVESLRTVVHPWPRANAAAAANYILVRRSATDRLAANHWEYVYYFRREIGDPAELALERQTGPGRLWMAFSTPDRAEQRRFRAALACRGRIVERKKFTFTSVYLVELSQPAGATRAGPDAVAGR
ncbi:MAG: hypothetical protein ACJ8F7_18215 [Gemmataceae bacterium]